MQPSVFPDGDVARTSLARLTSRLDAYLATLDSAVVFVFAELSSRRGL